MTRRLLLWLPFVLIAGVLAMFFVGLRNPPEHEIASKMVGRQFPEFTTVQALPDMAPAASSDLRDGKPRLVNVFASWCVPCIAEAPILMRLKGMGVEIEGIAIHDSPGDLAEFLRQNGNPYVRLGLDDGGRAGLAFGSSGVPETFVIDGNGKILYQHMRALTEQDIPMLLKLMGRGA